MRSQRAAAAEIERLGGHVRNVLPGNSLFHGLLYPTWIPDSLKQFYPMNFNYVHLADLEGIGDQHVARILSIPNLYGIDLSASDVSDRSLKHLQRYPRLREIVLRDVENVSSTGITDFKQAVPDCEILGM